MQRILSVIAIIDTPTPEGWINQLIDRLEARDKVQLNIVVQEPAGQPVDASDSLSESATHGDNASGGSMRGFRPASGSWPGRLASRLLHQRIDRPRFSANPWLRETLHASTSTQVLNAENCGTLLADCDVVLKLTGTKLPDPLWPPASVPVWDAHLETLGARTEDSLLQRESLNWVHLWSHSRGDGSHTVQTRRIASHALPRQSFSLTDLSRAAWFCLPALIDSRLNWLAHDSDPVSTEYSGSLPMAGRTIDPEVRAAHSRAEELQRRAYHPPARSGLHRLALALALWWSQSVERVRHHFWYEQWQLAFRNDGPDALFHSAGTETTAERLENSNRLDALANGRVGDFVTIDSPERVWWADPHLYRHEDDLYVFFEEMALDADYGHLSVARLTDEGRVESVAKVLDEGHHLSYPFVFNDDKEIYMIPETASMQSVQLYRAQHFPEQWVKVKDLLCNVNLADSTVHFDGERWWMFTNGMSHRSVDERDELHLYHADNVTGPWQAHPMNPVVTGVDRARMAGSIIRDGSGLYRPSQFGALRYGHGINLHRIDRLDLQSYSETTVGRLLPEAGSPWLGCHSTSYLDGVTVVDRVTRRRRH
ncbi:glucosamine inositolphosphorylceramide transferase family protein [Granulosicoccus sp. 3-233]|uniref:glucosamine inositolphosphorylceramide transferase family protein n=1 Tax=Granulosicoccus sp. 3-233 TaxID=3417969 RepID=UPI003D32C75A